MEERLHQNPKVSDQIKGKSGFKTRFSYLVWISNLHSLFLWLRIPRFCDCAFLVSLIAHSSFLSLRILLYQSNLRVSYLKVILILCESLNLLFCFVFIEEIKNTISTPIMPPRMLKRGRPKGAGLTVIGLPKKRKTTGAIPFLKKSPTEKERGKLKVLMAK